MTHRKENGMAGNRRSLLILLDQRDRENTGFTKVATEAPSSGSRH